MKKKITYSELIDLSVHLQKISGDDSPLLRKKIRFAKNVKSIVESYNERLQEIEEEFALTDEKNKGAFLLDEQGRFRFNAAQSKLRLGKLKLLKAEEIEVDVVECTDMASIDALDYETKLALNGFLFKIELSED